MIEHAITCYRCHSNIMSMMGCTVSAKIYQCRFCGYRLTRETTKPKPDPKPLTVKKAIKYLRKHPEVDSMTLSGMSYNDHSQSDVLFEYSCDHEEIIIGYQDIFELVPIHRKIYTNKLKISLIKDTNK